jgi:DNA-binding beta-propeller fold protein YncE
MNRNYLIALLIFPVLLVITAGSVRTTEATQSFAPRGLYAVNESSKDRGSISVYDIDAGHRLIKTIQTVPGVGDVRGVAVSAVTAKLYVAYRDFPAPEWSIA